MNHDQLVTALESLSAQAKAGTFNGFIFVGLTSRPEDDQAGIVGEVDFQTAQRSVGSLRMIEQMLVQLMLEADARQIGGPGH